jgi:alkaline phosphatase
MKRRDFFKNAALTAAGAALVSPKQALSQATGLLQVGPKFKKAKNIIFMVSDGMSMGTFQMANVLRERKEGKSTHWVQLYQEGKVARGLMDMASADSIVTDSSAASSSWGGGVRVNNGAVNVSPDGTHNKPILQKFKAAGKSVGCVTTVEITHATPSGFSLSSESRNDMAIFAKMHLDLGFDVLLGGGREYFDGQMRKDKQDLFGQYANKGYRVAKTRDELLALDRTAENKPLLGIFNVGALPYSIDRAHNPELEARTPTLAEMTGAAIRHLSRNKNGFVMQVEGGKVDWAAHANDIGALLYDQLAFDEAVATAIDFAEKDGETLVVITTDHGNSNPGLYMSSRANRNFERIFTHKHSNDWVLQGIDRNFTADQIRERFEYAQGIQITSAEALSLLGHYVTERNEQGLYNPYSLPFRDLARLQEKYTSVSWGGTNHTGDYVEIAAFGPGKELLPPFIRNVQVHQWLLEAADVPAKFRL